MHLGLVLHYSDSRHPRARVLRQGIKRVAPESGAQACAHIFPKQDNIEARNAVL